MAHEGNAFLHRLPLDRRAASRHPNRPGSQQAGTRTTLVGSTGQGVGQLRYLLFNGEYYSLWVDGKTRDEMCMTDQISGEWFTHSIGLPTLDLRKEPQQSHRQHLQTQFQSGVWTAQCHCAQAWRGLAGAQQFAGWRTVVRNRICLCFVADGLWPICRRSQSRRSNPPQVSARRPAMEPRGMRRPLLPRHEQLGHDAGSHRLQTRYAKPISGHCSHAPGDFHAPWVTASGFGTIRRMALPFRSTAPMESSI